MRIKTDETRIFNGGKRTAPCRGISPTNNYTVTDLSA